MAFAAKYILGQDDYLDHDRYLADALQKVVDERKENPMSATDPDVLDLMLKYARTETVLEDENIVKGNVKKHVSDLEVRFGERR